EVVVQARDGMFDKIQPIEVPALDPADRVDGHLGIIRDFMRAIETGTEPETRGADNIKSLAMVFGAIESAETGRRVMIAEEAQ
ncbi:gfo/Idh/MocA family oxidoreductase, partial [Mesorhizobium sp. M8A.F.Ca.ET.023.02.2.1]